MAISIRQQSPVTVVSTNASTVSATLPSAPVSGNKIVFLAIVDKAAGTFTGPTGFTVRQSRTATSISLIVAEKTSDGTESSAISASWTGTVTRPKAIVVELQASGTLSYDSSAQNGTESAVTSLASGTATTGANAAFALAVFGNDSAKANPADPDPTPTLSGGFSVLAQEWTATAGIGEPGFVFGSGSVSPSSTAATTATFTGATADQMAGAIIVFAESGDTTPPTMSSATVASNGTTVTLAFNETVSVGAGGSSGFVISPSGGAATISYSSGSGSSSLVYTASRTIYQGETLTIAYTQPGNGIEDSSGNDLASFSATSATNNSTQVAPSGPTITSTSDDTPTNGSSITISGSNFGATTGTLTAAGVSWTVTSWSDTSITATVAIGANKYNTNVSLVVTTSGAVSSSGYNVQIQPASGVSYVNLSGTLASSGDRITATPDLASGDQLEISSVQGGTISDVTVSADASFSVASGVTSFRVRVNDGTGWGSYGTQYINPETPTSSFAVLVRDIFSDIAKDIVKDIGNS